MRSDTVCSVSTPANNWQQWINHNYFKEGEILFKLDKEVELTPEIILKIVRQHVSLKRPRLKKLHDYYLTKHEIHRRAMSDPTKPNNKIANAYPGYITDTLVGYFVGKPITYNCAD